MLASAEQYDFLNGTYAEYILRPIPLCSDHHFILLPCDELTRLFLRYEHGFYSSCPLQPSTPRHYTRIGPFNSFRHPSHQFPRPPAFHRRLSPLLLFDTLQHLQLQKRFEDSPLASSQGRRRGSREALPKHPRRSQVPPKTH